MANEKELKLHDGTALLIPSGWTVEIEKTLESSAASLSDGTGYAKVTPTIIARLVPSENAQGEKPGSGWSKRNLNVQYVGGIVATGIAEAEQPEALAFAVTSTDIEESMEQSRDVRIRADSPRTYETGYLDGYVDGVMVTQDLEPVSPPPRAEINTTAPVESEEELWDEMVGRCMEFTSFNYALAQKLYVITRKTVEP